MLPFLRTKTTIPQTRSRQIERGQLLNRMDEATDCCLTLIVAPAGFGKTTLAAAWARKARIPVAWLSLQSTDQPPDRFLSYLVQALQTIAPFLGQTTLALLQSASPDGVLYALLNDLAEFQNDFALILDDYHTADCPEVAQIIQFLLEHRPPNLHLIITSRVTPSLSLTRLRAQGQVVEISALDLRFSTDEIRDFFERSMSLQLSAAEIDRLGQLTEGWAAGLQLAGLTMAQHPVDWNLPVSQALIFDYLAEEVLHREPPEVQKFLKTTGLFDRFCISLCEDLDGAIQPDAKQLKEILAYIERSNLFLVPLDATGTWFRYHALFTDFLRRQLPAEEQPPLYMAASRWFEQNGLLEDAIHYAIHAADFERAAQMLEGFYLDLIQRGEQAALSDWIATMPSAVLDRHPRLKLALGWANVVTLNVDEALRCVEGIETQIPPDGAGNRARGEAKALRVLANIFAGKGSATEEIESAFDLLAQQDDFLHCLLHFNLGMNFVMEGKTARGVEEFAEAVRLSAALKIPLLAIVAQVQLAETRQIRGALGLSERAFQQVIRYATETLGEHTFLLGMPYISYADLLREQNRFDQAVWYAEKGIQYCHRWALVASMDGQIALARLRAAQRHWEEAFRILEDAVQIAETSASVLDDTFVSVHLARLAVLQGDIAKAERYINAYELEKAGEKAYFHLREMIQLVLLRAKVAHLVDDSAAAPAIIEQLSTLIAEAERLERVTPAIEALIVRAYAEHAYAQSINGIGKRGTEKFTAAFSLSKAFTLGAQSGYVRIFADEGQLLLNLLELYREQIHAPNSYVEQIVQILRSESSQQHGGYKHQLAGVRAAPAATSDGLVPLTRRELDILRHMAEGMSNQEIAAEYTLAITTVKKHVANILAKLDVSNRTQAVTLARKRSWIK